MSTVVCKKMCIWTCIAYSGDGDEVLIREHLKQEVHGHLHEAERLPVRTAAPEVRVQYIMINVVIQVSEKKSELIFKAFKENIVLL